MRAAQRLFSSALRTSMASVSHSGSVNRPAATTAAATSPHPTRLPPRLADRVRPPPPAPPVDAKKGAKAANSKAKAKPSTRPPVRNKPKGEFTQLVAVVGGGPGGAADASTDDASGGFECLGLDGRVLVSCAF
jgi:hypothetical protein